MIRVLISIGACAGCENETLHWRPGTLQVTSLAFTPDGQHLLSGDEEGNVNAWDLRQAKRAHSGKAHSGPVWSLATSHGSGAILASGTARQTLASPFCYCRSMLCKCDGRMS